MASCIGWMNVISGKSATASTASRLNWARTLLLSRVEPRIFRPCLLQFPEQLVVDAGRDIDDHFALLVVAQRHIERVDVVGNLLAAMVLDPVHAPGIHLPATVGARGLFAHQPFDLSANPRAQLILVLAVVVTASGAQGDRARDDDERQQEGPQAVRSNIHMIHELLKVLARKGESAP